MPSSRPRFLEVRKLADFGLVKRLKLFGFDIPKSAKVDSDWPDLFYEVFPLVMAELL